MTPFRLLTCAAAALALVTGGAAGAASASSSCTVMSDAAGDATGTEMGWATPPPGLVTPPEDPYLDVLSATLASDGKTVTTALRMQDIGVDPTSPDSSFFWVSFTVAGQELTLWADWSPALSWDYWWINHTAETTGDARGMVDTDRNEIRMTVPASYLTPQLKRGAKLTNIHVQTGRFYPIGLGAFQTVDRAATAKTHVVGSKSCLKPVP